MSTANEAAQTNTNAASKADVEAVKTAVESVAEGKAEANLYDKEQPKTETVETKTEAKTEAKVEKVVPEKYEFKTDGLVLDATLIEKTAAYAKAQGFSQEQAQALLNHQNETVSSYVVAQQENLKTKTTQWAEEIKADKEFGGDKFNETAEYAKRAFEKFADPEFKQMLNDTGLGNYPALVKAFAKVGKLLANDSMVSGKSSAPQKSFADAFYDKT